MVHRTLGAVSSGASTLVLFNSHGDQSRLLQPVAMQLRQRFGVLAVYANWFDVGIGRDSTTGRNSISASLQAPSRPQ